MRRLRYWCFAHFGDFVVGVFVVGLILAFAGFCYVAAHLLGGIGR